MEHIYFWRPEEKHGFLSNWYLSPFTTNGHPFLHNEQYFMWRKQQLFDATNEALEHNILQTTDPKTIKTLGRLVKHFHPSTWDEHKYDIMKCGLLEKFSQNPDLLARLLHTKDAILVEASPYDTVWGIGLTAKEATQGKPWKGENLLGKALMDVRETLQSSK